MRDDEEMVQAVIASADAFLNGETQFLPDSEGTDIDSFVSLESERFASLLRSYLQERCMYGDFL